VSHHLSATNETICRIKANIDAMWPYIESGIEAIVVTASGCGAMVQEYGHLLRDDPAYAEKAARVTALCRDPVQILEGLETNTAGKGRRVAFQSPCSLQHALKLEGRVEALLKRAGFELLPVEDAAVCCGSAGTYSILQPKLAGELKSRKLASLQKHQPEIIATANIGCLAHLNTASAVPVVHWLELLEKAALRA
jgi:glycolate oxidase iron-sulfur subunit